MEGYWTTSVTLALLTCTTGGFRTKDEDIKTAEGSLVKVSPQARHPYLEMVTEEGQQLRLAVDVRRTWVSVGHARLGWNQLRSGQRIRVHYVRQPHGEVARDIDVAVDMTIRHQRPAEFFQPERAWAAEVQEPATALAN